MYEDGDTRTQVTEGTGAVEGGKPSVQQTESVIRGHVIAALAAGLVPVPLFDLAAVVAVMVKMVYSLGSLYKVPFMGNIARSLIVSLLAGAIPVTFAAGFASMIKLIPGLGTIAGSVSMSVLAGGLTYAVGRVFVQHFESGGTFLDFDPTKVRGEFSKAFEQGKAYAKQLEPEARKAKGSPAERAVG
jgi:uncharacterized protein (DUF697 family)